MYRFNSDLYYQLVDLRGKYSEHKLKSIDSDFVVAMSLLTY